MILITGANGFIGSHIVKLMVSHGARVRGLVRRTGNLSNIKDVLPRMELIEGDILDKTSLQRAFEGVSACIHTAALVKSGDHSTADYFSTNLTGTMNVCDAAMSRGVRRLVYTSTCETLRAPSFLSSPRSLPLNVLIGGRGSHVNGRDSRVRGNDTLSDKFITESINNSYSDMVGDYGRSKFLAEEHVKMCVGRGLPAVILNPTGVVGAGDINVTPPNALLFAYCKGEIPFYFETGFNVIDIRDAAQAHVLAMDHGRVGERYIIGNSNALLSHIFRLLDEASGKRHFSLKIPYFLVGAGMKLLPIKRSWKEKVAASRRPFFLDNAKAMRELGWRPEFGLKESLKSALCCS
jgi:dihydroflavonol-4-reductase